MPCIAMAGANRRRMRPSMRFGSNGYVVHMTDEQMTNDEEHDDGSVEPDPTDPDRKDVDRLDDDAPGASLFEAGDDNEPSEPA